MDNPFSEVSQNFRSLSDVLRTFFEVFRTFPDVSWTFLNFPTFFQSFRNFSQDFPNFSPRCPQNLVWVVHGISCPGMSCPRTLNLIFCENYLHTAGANQLKDPHGKFELTSETETDDLDNNIQEVEFRLNELLEPKICQLC